MRQVLAGDVARIAPAAYRAYVQRFVDSSRDFMRTVASFGLPLESEVSAALRQARTAALVNELRAAGTAFRNDDKSIACGSLSPACERCRTGQRSVSEFISLACPHSCWFCFNENQFDFKQYRAAKKDWKAELDAYAAAMGTLDYVALTGGEPLLYLDETLEFIAHAKQLNPKAHVRLYTSGWKLDAAGLARLAQAGLSEIRFSLKLDGDVERDGFASGAAAAESLDEQLARVEQAVGVIPAIMVEMPVMPGTEEVMRDILRRLDGAGAFGINLLELCFPLHNAQAYKVRGLVLRRDPYRIPYQYGYAGALPVAGSEELALRLMKWAIGEGLSLGIHYCSLENKNTAQLFEQNNGGTFDIAPYRFSQVDFFYKTVRAFGDDAKAVVNVLDGKGLEYECDEACNMVAFDPVHLPVCVEGMGLVSAQRGSVAPTLFLASATVEAGEDGKKRFREVGLHVLEREDFTAIASGMQDACNMSYSPFAYGSKAEGGGR